VREPGVEDATRRTRLANERTYLAWWRTGLTALAVAVAIGRLVPAAASSHVTRWPYEAVGSGFALLGLAMIVGGWWRARAVERALDRGSFAPLGDRVGFTLTAVGLALSIATLALVASAG